MAEVRCPMCGKFNPPDLEACSFCQARLTPLVAPPAGESPSTPDQQSEDTLDWLHELREPDESAFEPDRQSDPPSEAGAEKAAATDSDWLSDMRFDAGDSETTEDDSEPDNYEEDWLGRLGTSGVTTDETSPAMEPETNSEETLEAADIPDWMQALAPQAEEPEETPDWMRASLSEQDEPEVPDWMRSAAPAESSAEADADAAPADIPDWMREFAPTEEEVEPEEALPGWLSGLDMADEPDAAESEAIDAAAAVEDSPGWLSELATPGRETVDESDESAEFPSIAPEKPLRPAEDIPEWLRSEIAREEESHPAQRRPDQETEPAAQDEGLPPWMQTSLAATEASQPADEFDWMDEPDTSAETSDLAAGGLAAGLAGAGAFASEIFEDDDEALAAEPPDWFDELPDDFSAFEQAEPSAGAEAEIEPGLAPAELPRWLEAMRPIGTEASARAGEGDEDRGIEGAGPLAGLSGVLPAEPEILRVSKPATYSVKLQVTENQQEHADLLARLIEMEGVAQPLPPKAALSAQHILRLVIGLILIGVILVPLLLGFPVAPLPDAPIELTAFSQVVTQLNGGDPVLIAFDYIPAASGEMDAVAAPIIEHMMIEGAYLTLVSTNPTGPLQAERLLAAVRQQSGRAYAPGSQYLNLGFIPGGQAGLASLVLRLRQTTPISMHEISEQNLSSAWDAAPLNGINTLADFALVLVITESPDTARAWVEQVGPALDDTPLLLAVSAQAEPLVRPYAGAGANQVQGLISSISGGVYYDYLQFRRQPGVFWSAYSLGAWAAVVLILLGGLINLILGSVGGRRTRPAAAQPPASSAGGAQEEKR